MHWMSFIGLRPKACHFLGGILQEESTWKKSGMSDIVDINRKRQDNVYEKGEYSSTWQK